MNKWVQISVISVLGVGLCVVLVLYIMNLSSLNSAQEEITDKDNTISSLEAEINGLKADLSNSEAEAEELKTELATSEAECASLTGEVSDLTAQTVSLGSQLSSTQSSLSAAQTLNSGLTQDLKTVTDPRHFGSVSELSDWLQQDNTDEEYEDLRGSNYLQMSYILQVRALRDGYILPAYVIPLTSTAVWISNIACIGDTLYLVEAGDDSVDEYFVHTAVPSHPEPLP